MRKVPSAVCTIVKLGGHFLKRAAYPELAARGALVSSSLGRESTRERCRARIRMLCGGAAPAGQARGAEARGGPPPGRDSAPSPLPYDPHRAAARDDTPHEPLEGRRRGRGGRAAACLRRRARREWASGTRLQAHRRGGECRWGRSAAARTPGGRTRVRGRARARGVRG